MNGELDQKKITRQKYRELNRYVQKGQILFVGSSLAECFPIEELQLSQAFDSIIYNRGICGSKTCDLLEAMDECIFELAPSKIFINIGSNDIGGMDGGGYRPEVLIENYAKVLSQIKERLPDCEVFVMAYYPVNNVLFPTRTNANIQDANAAVEQLAGRYGFRYINVNEGLVDETGNLKAAFTMDGVHLWPGAYAVILENLKAYI